MTQIFQFGTYFGLLFAFMLAADYIWLKFIVGDFFLQELSLIARIKDKQFDLLILPALGSYLLMCLSVVIFIRPHYHTYTSALMFGAMLGFFLYGVFDLTNMALLKNYSWKFVAVDMAWGTFLISISSGFSLLLSKWLCLEVS